jgi:hypothetical protein
MKYKKKRHQVTQPADAAVRLIPLTQGQNAIIDAADFEWLSQWNWFAMRNTRAESFYAARKKNGKIWGMHCEVLGCGPGEEGDHWSHDTLDNRRSNLRLCSRAQNQHNRRKARRNQSGFKGVCFVARRSKYLSQIRVASKHVFLGLFDFAEDAARAYDAAARKFFGEFALVNFPERIVSQKTLTLPCKLSDFPRHGDADIFF